MKKFRINEITCTETRMLPEVSRGRKITHGGVYVFKPGEMAHPEPHIHDTDELFIFVQGKGVLPIDGIEYPIETGDVFLIEAGEDHHTTSSMDEPLVAVWYLFDQ